jgi:hypothetical protein
MPSDEEVTQRAGSLRSMTGLTEAEFMARLPHFEQAFVGYRQDRTIDGQPRTSRRSRTYASCPLPTTADKLLFILTYVQQSPIQEVQGQLVGMSQSHANTWIHLLHPVLNPALADRALLPAHTADDLATMLAVPRTEAHAPSPLVFMMGPNDPSSVRKTLKISTSITVASKKGHTIKNLLVITETRHMCFLSAPSEGRTHEKCIADLAGYTWPPGSGLDQETGFQGFLLAGVTTCQPKKKPRGGELTPPEQATNRRLASLRIRIAHAISGVKRDRMVQDKIRLLKDGIRDIMMETCCGLHTFRLLYRPWNYAN